MSRESDLDKTTRTVTKLFHKVKQTTSSKHEFLHFELLNTTEKVQIQIEDFSYIQRAIFNFARQKTFDPIPFFIKDKRTGAILFRVELQAGRGFVVQDLKLPDQERKLMLFTLPNNPLGNQSTSVERTVGKLQVTTDETLHKIGLVLSPNSDQYSVHNVFKTSSDIQIRVTNPWWYKITKMCCKYYAKCYKFIKDGTVVAKLFSGDSDSKKILTIHYLHNPGEQTRATILGAALYFTLTALPELMRLLDSTLPESTARVIDV